MQKKTRTKRAKPIAPAPQTVAPNMIDEAQANRFAEYLSPDFTRRLAEHMHRAVKAAVLDAKDR